MVMHIRSVLAALLLASLVLAQESGPPNFRLGVKVVVAPTVVMSKDGDYVNDLQPWNFQLTDNGKPQNIKVDVTYVPKSMVVAVQANAAAESELPKIRKIGSLLKPQMMGDQGEVAIVAFDSRVRVLQDFTSDTDKLELALHKLNAGSSLSCVNDAVEECARMLNRRPPERRRVLLLISETRDNGSKAKVRDAMTALEFDNVTVYSVNISHLMTLLTAKQMPPPPNPIPATAMPMPAGVPPTPENARQMYGNPTNSANFVPAFEEIFKEVKGIFVRDPVTVYTRFTGGRERSFLSQKDLENAISDIGNELHSEYLITYSPDNKEEAGFHDIAVSVDRPNVKVRTRPGYWVASQN
jgi:VWFA-related protein